MDIKPIFLSLMRNKFMAILMIVQIAFTMAVLSSSVLMAAFTLKEWNLPSGIPHNDIIRITPTFYDDTRDVGLAIVNDLDRVKQIPGVKAIAPSSQVPFTAEQVSEVYISSEQDAEAFQTNIFDTNKDLFNVLDLELKEGRWLTDADLMQGHQDNLTEKPAVVMISEDMARDLFAEEPALGKTIWLAKEADPVQVVGIYSNFMNGERLNGRGHSYRTIIRPQVSWSQTSQPQYLIRVEKGTAAGMLEDIVAVFYQEQGRYINRSELLKRVQKRMYDGRGSRALTFLVISSVLLIITAFGMAGLTSYHVNQRKKQIGTRRALGAKKRDIISYFLTETTLVTFVGLLFGVVFAFITIFDASAQSGQNIMSAGILIALAAFIWAINIAAVYFPVKRASEVAPAIVTRSA